jgi:ribose/xylose/arabinose/galactoside ABC-type transport system permease subunit
VSIGDPSGTAAIQEVVPTPGAAAAARRTGGWKRLAHPDAMLPIFIALIALAAGLIQPRFWSVDNLLNLLRQMVPLMIISVGQAFAIIVGGLDLSVAAVMSLAGVAGVLVMQEAGIIPGILVMLAVGMSVGGVSGFVIAYLRTTPLVVTLGMLSVAQGLALISSGGVPIYDVPPAFVQLIGFDKILGIPIMVWIAAGVAIVAALILKRTVFGRYIYAIGSSAAAAAKSGVDVKLCTMLVYVFSGLCAAIGAIVLTAWVSSAQPIAAPNITLESLAAVVLGGVALTGGSGSIRQVFLGVLVLSMLSNVMNMIGVSAYFQTLVVGIVIILAVILDRIRRRERA